MHTSNEVRRRVLVYDPGLTIIDSWRVHTKLPKTIEVRLRIGRGEYTAEVEMRWRRISRATFVAPVSDRATWISQPVVVVKGTLPLALQLEQTPSHVVELMEDW